MNADKCPYCGATKEDDLHIGDCPIRLLMEIDRLRASAIVSLGRINDLMRENQRLKDLLEKRNDKA